MTVLCINIQGKANRNSPEEIVSDEAGDVVLCVPEYCSNAVQHLSTHPTTDTTSPWRRGRGRLVRPGQRWSQAVVVVTVGGGRLGQWGGEGVVEPGQQDRHSFHAAASHTQLIKKSYGCIQVGASWLYKEKYIRYNLQCNTNSFALSTLAPRY